MGYTPEWEDILRRMRLELDEFADIAGISQPHMAKIARGQLRRSLSKEMQERIDAALAMHCECCGQYMEKKNGSDPKKAKKGSSAR